MDPANGISTSVLQKKVASGKDALDILFDTAVQEKEVHTPSGATATSAASPETLPTYNESVWHISEADTLRIWRGCRFVKGG